MTHFDSNSTAAPRFLAEPRSAIPIVDDQPYHDPLTNLPSRMLLRDRCGQALQLAAKRLSELGCGVVRGYLYWRPLALPAFRPLLESQGP